MSNNTADVQLNAQEIQVLRGFGFAGNMMWVSEAKREFSTQGDIIQSLLDKKLVAFDSAIIQVTDKGRHAFAAATAQEK